MLHITTQHTTNISQIPLTLIFKLIVKNINPTINKLIQTILLQSNLFCYTESHEYIPTIISTQNQMFGMPD